MAFTRAQQVQIDRLPASRVAVLDMSKLEKFTVAQLRARVNVESVALVTVEYTPENDYTAQEQATIADVLYAGDKWMIRIPEILAEGLSVQQRVTALEGR